MSKLTTSERKKLPSSDFVFPAKRAYPIEDEEHGRKAVQLAGRVGGATEARVDRAVHKKYPDIKISKNKK